MGGVASYTEDDLKSTAGRLAMVPLRLRREIESAAEDGRLSRAIDDIRAECVARFGRREGEALYWEAMGRAARVLETVVQLIDRHAGDAD